MSQKESHVYDHRFKRRKGPRRRLAQRAWRASAARRAVGPLADDLPVEVRERLSDELIDELLAGARSEEEIVGPGGVLADLTHRLVERANRGPGHAPVALEDCKYVDFSPTEAFNHLLDHVRNGAG